MTNIIGTNGNDTLVGSNSDDTINGKAGNDTITVNSGNDTLTGGTGKDKFIFDYRNYNYSYLAPRIITLITDFAGVGKGTKPTAGVIDEADTLIFQGTDFTAKNLLLTQNGNNVEISFETPLNIFSSPSPKVILQNFKLENLDNFSKSTGATVNLGNILFDGQTTITDSFDVFNANSTQSTIFNKNTVTFLNDLNNNVKGFDNSDDVINGQGGNDIIDGLSGNDLLRGGTGNDTLYGGAGNDTLNASGSTGDNLLNGGDGNDFLYAFGYHYESTDPPQINDLLSSGNNTLNGGAGDDTLNASGSTGDNLLNGGDGNDSISISGFTEDIPTFGGDLFRDTYSLGNNTLNGGAGNDTLNASGSTGDNLLNGGDGNDSISISGFPVYNTDYYYDTQSSGNNTLNGGAGNDTLNASGSTGDNLLNGGDGNDYIYVASRSSYPPITFLVTQTVDGGKGDDLLSVDYSNATGGLTTTFNSTTNISLITAGTNSLSYKNIERLNIVGTAFDDKILGKDGNDTLSTGSGGKDTIDGGKGDDLLFIDYSDATGGLTTTFNPTTNIGSITAGTDSVSYKNIERLNIVGTAFDDKILGKDSNDTLSTGSGGKDTIDGGKGDDVLSVDYSDATGGLTTTFNPTTNIGSITAGTDSVSYKNIERLNILGTAFDDNIVGKDGNDTLSGDSGNDTLTGSKGKDTFVYDNSYDTGNYRSLGTDTITDFGGVGKGSNPSASVINSLDTLQYTGAQFTAQNLQLTQNGNNLEITFEDDYYNNKVILQNFKLENLDNLPATSSRSAIGNILFDGQTSITDSFDVFDANSTQTTLLKRNTVTFLNDLDNNIIGFDNSNDVINGQGGDDIINGKSGNDILRGGAGNDTLIGGAGNDTLESDTGNNILDGGVGDDVLNASGSTGNNTLNGGIGDDNLSASGSTGNNTLNGGAGDDTLNVSTSTGNNLLFGGDGNDYIVSGLLKYDDVSSLGNNTLNGGVGDDTLNVSGSKGNNLADGGDGNDLFYVSTTSSDIAPSDLITQTIDGGKGDDLLFIDYSNATKGITSIFNATTNTGTITAGINSVSYKNIEGLNVVGTAYDDNIAGSNGNDTLSGGYGGKDTIDGGKGDDLLFINYNNATKGITSIFNATTNTGTITAGINSVSYKNIEGLNVVGTYYNDNIVGSNGNDTLSGGSGGNDTLTGGNGIDTFAFAYYNVGVDSLYDFNATNDLIQVSANGFYTGLSSGSLQKSQFTIGASASTSEERFIYNNATGALYFDADGSAANFTQVKFAQLSAGLSLTNNNFVVI
ncbi:calcium-binding protein [Nostoc sp. KVJ3]|uniref:beta strand repeat-containing protein n=1 Tax=Nostoc sp. KVJ3 TaxID=457945 RepID=UPI002237D832|nr:calcium-binding protein [Nostoc sp. KVJ3]MCW5314167.1 calcium-binding protein [Nostoc sp. KVJ3]